MLPLRNPDETPRSSEAIALARPEFLIVGPHPDLRTSDRGRVSWQVGVRLTNEPYLFESPNWEDEDRRRRGRIAHALGMLLVWSDEGTSIREKKRLKRLVDRLLGIPGVSGIIVEQYEITVNKTGLQFWATVIGQVEDVLSEELRALPPLR
ncbi:hypothetical protein KW797_01795 [Candidatus Parcubacteria bacterium]|nr:hypothetical protein [Candidatus Parcubacteria bacterium]